MKRRVADERSARFRLLYAHIEPKITEFVVFLLRLLLTSCHRILGSGERPEDRPCGDGEAKRHKAIMAQAVSGILALLLDESRRADPRIFHDVAHWITETNGYLVVLKFLNQDLVCTPDPARPQAVLPLLKETPNPLPPALEMATFQLLRCLYSLCKNSPERVRKYLVHYKAPFILKKLRSLDHAGIKRLVLKLLKKQVRYLPRKWKQTNMKIVSAIYAEVPTAPLDDWLLTDPLNDASTEGPVAQAPATVDNFAGVKDGLENLNLESGAVDPEQLADWAEANVFRYSAMFPARGG